MATIIASRPRGVNTRPAPAVARRLTFEQGLRLERRLLAAEVAQAPDRPCFPNADPWDDNVRQEVARNLCGGCPVAYACGRTAVIDEALVIVHSGRINLLNAIVSGTRGGMTARARRPIVAELADRIITDRMERTEHARAEAERKRAKAEAAKAGAAT